MDNAAQVTQSLAGVFAGGINDKGRLALPKEFEDFLRSYNNHRIFLATVDHEILRIYPAPEWDRQLQTIRSAAERDQFAFRPPARVNDFETLH
ncbi:MAG: hypothetical protein DMG76_05235 [Acidobacteria bacterium]|nr:MAG: hypothetical protein DMG76_05235 [Acidobacteriota bacterium]